MIATRDWDLKVINKTKKMVLLGLLVCIASASVAKLTGSLAPDAISKRLAPMGQVNILGATQSSNTQETTKGVASPQQIYDDNCKMCHQSGLAGAPKFGNKADWEPRIAQGIDTLVKTAITGIRAMPPKGNCLSCTSDEIKATVEYMVHAAE